MVTGLKALADTGLDIVSTRARLFALEVEIEQRRVLKSLIYAAAGLMAAFAATTVLVVFVIATLWDSPYRLYLILSLLICTLLAGCAFVWRAKQSVLASPRPFEATLDALARDLAAMK